MAVSGVRISWLMLARNRLLATLADSAASFASRIVALASSSRRRLRQEQGVHVEKLDSAGGFDDQHGIEDAVCRAVQGGAGRLVHAAVGRHNLRLDVDDLDHLRDRPLHEEFERERVAQSLEKGGPRNDADEFAADFAGTEAADRFVGDDHADEVRQPLEQLRDIAGRSLQGDALAESGKFADCQARTESSEKCIRHGIRDGSRNGAASARFDRGRQSDRRRAKRTVRFGPSYFDRPPATNQDLMKIGRSRVAVLSFAAALVRQLCSPSGDARCPSAFSGQRFAVVALPRSPRDRT